MDDKEAGLGWHIVAFLDALGQSQKLRKITSVPRTREEIAAAAPLIRDTALYVMDLRNIFRSCFDSFTGSTGVLTDVAQELQAAVESSKRSIGFYGFSDSFVCSMPLREKLPSIAIGGTLVAASGAMCWSLSKKIPLRGGIDAGLGVNISAGEVYGPVLDSAYRLECSAAKYPRILIGDELWKYLTLAAQDDGEAGIHRKVEQERARQCMRWVQIDRDGQRSLDYLTVLNEIDQDSWSPRVRESLSFIREQERAFLDQGNEKLAPRYAQLRDYFEGRARLWNLTNESATLSVAGGARTMHREPKFLGFESGGGFNRRYPNFLTDCEPLVRFMTGINQRQAPAEHQNAVHSQLLFCWELFTSVVKLVQTGLPTAPVALGRNLMESVMGCIYLTDHPEKLQDFKDEAEYVMLRIREPSGSAEEHRYKQLKARFGNQGWHRMSVAELAKATGFDPAYETFYREACTITHGGALPLLVLRSGIGTCDLGATEDPDGSRDYATIALRYAALLIFFVCQHTNMKFNFGHEGDLKQFWESCEQRGWFINSEANEPSAAQPPPLWE